MFFRFLILPALVLFSALPVSAATLYLEPARGSLGPGSKIAVDVLLDVEECANAIEADIGFPKDDLLLRDFIIGDSILSLWIERPDEAGIAAANENGVLHFSGGVPGGYCGRIPGDTGRSNTVARLIFEVPSFSVGEESASSLDISFLSTSKVLLNDGFGTADNLVTKSANYLYQTTPVETDKSWQEEMDADTIAPEPFVIELRRKADIFDNQYYIIFNTVDKQSGIDHYEVLEIRPEEEMGVIKGLPWWKKLFGQKYETPSWKIGEMPYLLSDQALLSTIRVKAIDKAGNERFVEFIPEESRAVDKETSNRLVIGLIVLVLLLLVFSFAYLIRKIIIKKRHDREEDSE